MMFGSLRFTLNNGLFRGNSVDSLGATSVFAYPKEPTSLEVASLDSSNAGRQSSVCLHAYFVSSPRSSLRVDLPDLFQSRVVGCFEYGSTRIITKILLITPAASLSTGLVSSAIHEIALS